MKHLLVGFAVLMMFLAAEMAHGQSPVSSNFSGYQGVTMPAVSVSIANGQTTSAAIALNGFSLVGCQLPAAFTGTTLTFTESSDGTNYFPVYNSSGAVSYTVAQGHYYAISPADLQGLHYLKIVSGSSEAGARTLICSLKGI